MKKLFLEPSLEVLKFNASDRILLDLSSLLEGEEDEFQNNGG